MNKSKIFLVVIVCFLSIQAVKVDYDKYFEIVKNIEIFTNVYKELNINYVDELDPGKLMKTGIDAMVTSLDPYTVYYSESQIESYRIALEGKYDGAGATIKVVDDYVTIVEMYENSPALKSGLKIGDQILKVNGQSTKGKTNSEVIQILRGVPDTDVQLEIQRYGAMQPQMVTLNRGTVEIPNVPYSGLLKDDIAYVSLTTFTPNAGKNIKDALRKMKRENELKGVVLDLRDNGGGLLKEAIEICNIFLPKGKEVVSTKSKVKDRDVSYKTLKDAFDEEIPLAILINKSSASASEIVSGVIQDYDRGILLGQKSYGKGLVQNTKEVGYNSRVKITTSKYYIPSGRCIQSVDYENGEPKDIPDDQRSKFKTENGREVLDGGGVTPDIKLTPYKQPEVLTALLRQDKIFKFVHGFQQKNDSISTVDAFKFNDYKGFLSFLDKEDFSFKYQSEVEIEEFEEKAKLENNTETFKANVADIMKKIDLQKSNDLEEFKTEIIKEIESEIVSRYYFQQGRKQHNLSKDSEIDEAVSLLLNKEKYAELLK